MFRDKEVSKFIKLDKHVFNKDEIVFITYENGELFIYLKIKQSVKVPASKTLATQFINKVMT